MNPAKPRTAVDLQVTFGSNVSAARLAAGLTQHELAQRAGMSQQYLSRIELGQINLTLRSMSQLAAELGQDVVCMLSRPTGSGSAPVEGL